MEAIDALLNRASVGRLTEPAPSAEQLEVMFQAAQRAPDHGQLRPWRFLVLEGPARERLGEILAQAGQAKGGEVNQAAVDKARGMPLRAPMVIVAIARLQEHPKVPKSEQSLAAGCATHGLILAAHALGVGAIWRTGELSYSAHVAKSLGVLEGEQIIGFIYLGSPEKGPKPISPAPVEAFVQRWP